MGHVIGAELWAEFAHDPRSPHNAAMRASDLDREVILRALTDAYAEGRLDREEYDERVDATSAAKTLGELPSLVEDLVPQAGIVPVGLTALSPQTLQEQAVARWERSRREALMTFLIPTLICWVVWAATMFGGFPWPLFPTVGTAIPLLATLIQKKDMIESNKRRILRRQEREYRRQLRRQPPPPQIGG